MNLSNYRIMGVINRTPDSFSDKGISLNPDFFQKQLSSFLADPKIIIDVGFESTAPMNNPITHVEELARFENFLEASKQFSFVDRFISFDTYKVKNFKHMAHEFKKVHPKAHFIFNDVSGCLDVELNEALIEFRGHNFYYIYTSAHIPERSKTLEHMKFIDEKTEIIESTATSFKAAYDWFKTFGMEHQLILDPGFGFSKTYEQNWRLVEHFNELEERLLEMKITNPILIGLSKKSFLKKAVNTSDVAATEALHQECIKKISKNSIMNLLFRVHDPKILSSSL
ncbi:MAG: dihydropteroate synthase [Rhizobacter sp.]|nr:dihydropteroate synthase [Bacteriovorax sp.]